MKRNLSTLDTDIGQDWSRLVKDAFADGIDCDLITEGGLETDKSAQAIMAVSATQNYALGTRRAHDGKVYRYAKCCTGTALIAGHLIQSAAYGGSVSSTAGHGLDIDTASTAGADYGYATLNSTGGVIAANKFKDGYYIVSDGSAVQGVGQMKKILSHPASSASGAEVKFTFTTPLEVLIASSTGAAGIIKNLYDDVVDAPTVMTGLSVGVAPVAVPVATPYFWLQTWGLCPLLIKTAMTAGTTVMRDAAAVGSGGIASGGSAPIAAEKIGESGWITDTTDNGFVYLNLAP